MNFVAVSFALLLNGCNDALVYGESTNFSLATVKINSDVAEPISVNAGFDRTIGTFAPQQGEGKEAMNMLSRFELLNDPEYLGKLRITTEFASGEAAKKMVEVNDQGTKNLMNYTTSQPEQ
ncbi:hypothetical protein [Thiosocius teredinicola]|uniref:hypothetical protein n=1 Tax=Thiosocius teredinicola TaxID=1973002 RepID=UPI000990BCC0